MISSKPVIFLPVVVVLVLSHGAIAGRNYMPITKTIKTDDGDEFDCVDINKQPAFEHPLLRDHIVQVEPEFISESSFSEASSGDKLTQIKLKDGGCPLGTIPIKRASKEEIRRLKALSKIQGTYSNSLNSPTPTTAQWALLPTIPGKYYGASAFINVYGLPQIQDPQLSNSQIWVINRFNNLNQPNVLAAGWTVNPHAFGDNKTRLFASWDGSGGRGCLNLACPGFVQVHNEIPLGYPIFPLSVYNGPQFEVKLEILQDPGTRNWWLYIRPERKPIGYWPKDLFNTLNDSATEIHFGGVVNYPSEIASPPMGSGHFPAEGKRKACYFREVRLASSQNYFRDIRNDEVAIAVETLPQCYKVGPYDKGFFHFGGPGHC